MKINEILKEDYGYGGVAKSGATGQKYFVDSVTKQLNAYIDSVRKAGAPLQVWEFVNSYLTKYGWTANSQQQTMLQGLAKDVEDEYNYFLQKQEKTQKPQQQVQQPSKPNLPLDPAARIDPTMEGIADSIAGSGIGQWAKAKAGTMAGSLVSKMGLGTVVKLANAMYAVGMTQHRDPRTGQVLKTTQQGAAQDGTVDNPVLANPTKQIIKTMTPMKGEDYKDDLESIVRLALTNLYKSDPGDYSSEVKRIMGQKPQQNPQNPQV